MVVPVLLDRAKRRSNRSNRMLWSQERQRLSWRRLVNVPLYEIAQCPVGSGQLEGFLRFGRMTSMLSSRPLHAIASRRYGATW